jgi:carbamoyl-phosphate synthase large subunit
MKLSLNIDLFKKIGTIVVVSSPNVIEISDNKQQTYDQLIKAGVNVPFTISASEININNANFPLILKQRIGGARSKNVYLVKNLSQWQTIIDSIGNNLSKYIIMEYIEGDEYTCGSINLDNNCKGVILMRRILRDGDTHKCFTIKNQIIENEVRLVLNAIKPFGACNVQLRLKNNIPYVFEINARCSGTTAARTLSGFNEPLMIADYILKNIEPIYEIKEQTILRYWKEIAIDNDIIHDLKSKSTLINNNYKKL